MTFKRKTSYFQSSSGVTSFALTTQVIQMNEWTPQVVENRQKDLVQLLIDAWGLDKNVDTGNLDDKHFYIETLTGIKATGYPTESGFIVEKGAIISSTLSNSVRDAIVNLRNELINNGVITDHGEYLEFIADYEFSSPSAASSVVFGRSSNGLTAWKLSDGKTLKEVQGQ